MLGNLTWHVAVLGVRPGVREVLIGPSTAEAQNLRGERALVEVDYDAMVITTPGFLINFVAVEPQLASIIRLGTEGIASAQLHLDIACEGPSDVVTRDPLELVLNPLNRRQHDVIYDFVAPLREPLVGSHVVPAKGIQSQVRYPSKRQSPLMGTQDLLWSSLAECTTAGRFHSLGVHQLLRPKGAERIVSIHELSGSCQEVASGFIVLPGASDTICDATFISSSFVRTPRGGGEDFLNHLRFSLMQRRNMPHRTKC